ncbi:ferrochelatase [Argonema antarcticum]|uniref:ferrochelatase n=1 Tax=Argonema antarcticum TaxID=2942763 RepID=UPI0020125145|nr:ferrochelatase [Argonema antarcticum]MCL1473424.1 ferrochelatase [Argonema antarcticum A004/B2]
MINCQSQATDSVASQSEDRVAVLLAGYGEVQSYRDLNLYNQAATKYIAAQFVPIPEWLYPLAGKILALQDFYNFGVKHHQFISPENEIFEKQRLGIEAQLQNRWGNRVEVFKGFYFCKPFVQQVVADINQQGFQHLLIYPLLVVDSAFTGAIAVEQVNEVIAANAPENNPQHSPFKSVRYIPSFATEPAYVDLMVHQIESELNQPLVSSFFESRIGIILVVHGGPEKAKGLLTGVIDGQALSDAVRSQLQQRYPLISIGWVNHDTPFINWSQPDLKQAAKSLIKSGAQAILFKPLGWATENYETILDVEDVIQSLRPQYPDVTYVRLNCVNDDPDFLKIAAVWANPHIEAMLNTQQILIGTLNSTY